MPKQVCTGAKLQCSFGASPSSLIAIPKGPPTFATVPNAATIKDHIPIANIPPFGMCTSLANPAVAAATAAAFGVLTPMPCIPVTPAPWAPGCPKVNINNTRALNNTSTCMCTWLGVISISDPGQNPIEIP
ncbi:MAG: DUF4280 domain-containing protein [Cyanobacteria bacterium P01_F01_bin.56]